MCYVDINVRATLDFQNLVIKLACFKSINCIFAESQILKMICYQLLLKFSLAIICLFDCKGKNHFFSASEKNSKYASFTSLYFQANR